MKIVVPYNRSGRTLVLNVQRQIDGFYRDDDNAFKDSGWNDADVATAVVIGPRNYSYQATVDESTWDDGDYLIEAIDTDGSGTGVFFAFIEVKDGAITTDSVILGSIDSLEAHGDIYWETVDLTGIALTTDIDSLKAHGDIYWETVDLTGIALTTDIDSLKAHGDSTWATVDISTLATSASIIALDIKINRLLGLAQENCYADEYTYDSESNCLTWRLRIYDSALNVGEDVTGLVATYECTATYSANRLDTFKVVKA